MAKDELSDDSNEKEELYSSYLDGELSEEEARAFEARLASSAEERANFQAMKKTWEMLDYLPKPDVTTSFTAKTMEKMHTMSGPATQPGLFVVNHPGIRAGVFAAVLMVLFAGGFGIGSYSSKNTVNVDEELIRNLRLYENKRLYEQIGSIEFLRKLDSPELFGQD